MNNSLAVTPDSEIRLLRCPLKLDNYNQITFSNVTEQTNYFLSLQYLYDNSMSYIKKDGVIRIGTTSSGQYQLTYEDIITYNYVMYKNTHYENKWFYAYITNVKYINDGCTEISIETDYFQTWQFDIVWKDSYIEREHVNNDTIGLHTIPENLETGDYISNGFDYTSSLDQTSYVLCATTLYDGTTPGNQVTNIAEIPYQGYIFTFDTASALATEVRAFEEYQKNIYAVYAVPHFCVENAISASAPYPSYLKEDIPANEMQITTSKQTTLDGYTPKNNKVRCFPYNYLLVSNNNGQSNILHYERFTTSNCTFGMTGIATIGADIKLTPLSYDRMNHDEQNALVAGKWPTLSWSENLFVNWASQNAINIGIGQATSALSIVGGIGLLATGGGTLYGLGMIGAGISGIASSMAQQYQHSMDPISFKGNVNSGSLNVCNERNGFYFYKMSVKAEYAKMIDDYFSAYGYKVNRIGTPHIHARSKWDYLKTINANLGGNIPNQDLKSLCNMLNVGVTFWHDTTNFLNYSVTNAIL